MKKWSKPELLIEEFRLEQSVAAGCGVDTEIIVTPGGYTTVYMGCRQQNGKGHWDANEGLIINDTNGNGKIDWSEFTAAVESARNGRTTGGGHQNHQEYVKLPDGTEIKYNEKPFTS